MIKTTSTILGLSLTLSLTHINFVVAAEINWDMPNEYPSTSVQGRGDKIFSKLLKEKSAGQIKISHHFGGALGLKSKDQLDAVGDGIVQVANTFIPPLGGIDPIFLLSSLPFLSSNSDEARILFDSARQDYDRVLAKFNQRLLYSSPWPPSGIWVRSHWSVIALPIILKCAPMMPMALWCSAAWVPHPLVELG